MVDHIIEIGTALIVAILLGYVAVAVFPHLF